MKTCCKEKSAPKQLNLKAKHCQHTTHKLTGVVCDVRRNALKISEHHHGIPVGLNDRAQVFMMRHVPKMESLPFTHDWKHQTNILSLKHSRSLSESTLYIVYTCLLLGRPLPHFIGPPSPTNDNSFRGAAICNGHAFGWLHLHQLEDEIDTHRPCEMHNVCKNHGPLSGQ